MQSKDQVTKQMMEAFSKNDARGSDAADLKVFLVVLFLLLLLQLLQLLFLLLLLLPWRAFIAQH